MKAVRNLLRVMCFTAFLAAFSGLLPAQPAGPEWNAWVNETNGWCFPCGSGAVGNPTICPCRIADPIIITS